MERPVTGGSWPAGRRRRQGCACLRALLCQSVFNNRFRSFRTRSIARPASTEFGSQQLRSLKSESLQIKATQSEAHSSRSTRRGRLAACSPATCRLQLAISFLLLSYPSAGLVCVHCKPNASTEWTGACMHAGCHSRPRAAASAAFPGDGDESTALAIDPRHTPVL